MLADLVAPAIRRLLLARLRRSNPAHLLVQSRAKAWQAVRDAARRSEAYRELLRDAGLERAVLDGAAGVAFEALPILTKAGTFGRFPLAALSGGAAAGEIADVLTSSGRGSQGFGFRLTGRQGHDRAWFGIDLGLQNMFEVDQRATLVVNCLPMGVSFSSRAVAVANVSVREDMACAILRDIGPRFQQTIVCTDPLFVNRLLEEGRRQGVDWSALRTSLILGEEMLVEPQRAYLEARLGIVSNPTGGRVVASSFGVGELGLNLLFETRETIRMRRVQRADGAASEPGDPSLLAESSQPALFCFDPLRCYIEVLDPGADGFGELCFTMLGGRELIPLPRYTTGDVGRLLGERETRELARRTGLGAPPWLPVLAVRGRAKDRTPGRPSIEAIKELIYTDHALAGVLTGAFKLAGERDGRAELRVRTTLLAAEERATVQSRLSALAGGRGLGHLRVIACGPEWGADPDYERKYDYHAA